MNIFWYFPKSELGQLKVDTYCVWKGICSIFSFLPMKQILAIKRQTEASLSFAFVGAILNDLNWSPIAPNLTLYLLLALCNFVVTISTKCLCSQSINEVKMLIIFDELSKIRARTIEISESLQVKNIYSIFSLLLIKQILVPIGLTSWLLFCYGAFVSSSGCQTRSLQSISGNVL